MELLKSDLRKLRYDLEEFIVEYRLDHEPHGPLGFDQLTTLQKLEIFSGVILLFAGLATRDLGRIIAGLGLLTIAFYFKNDPRWE